MTEIPDDPYMAFAVLVSRCGNGLMKELMETGKTETQARNAVIHCFLDFASGESCRVARREGREPDRDKWRAACEQLVQDGAETIDVGAGVGVASPGR